MKLYLRARGYDTRGRKPRLKEREKEPTSRLGAHTAYEPQHPEPGNWLLGLGSMTDRPRLALSRRAATHQELHKNLSTVCQRHL